MSEMPDERLADIALLIRSEYENDAIGEESFAAFLEVLHTMLSMAEDRDRLRARDEWLTVLLGRALVYVDAANMPASWELGDTIRLALSKEASNG